MRAASPGPTWPPNPVPAGTSATILSLTGISARSAARTAYPSIAETAKGGCVRRAATASASTRPSPSASGICSGGSGASGAVSRSPAPHIHPSPRPQRAAACAAPPTPRRGRGRARRRAGFARAAAAPAAPSAATALVRPKSRGNLLTSRVAAGFAEQAQIGDDHTALDRLAHVVDRQGGDACRDQRLHFDAGARPRFAGGGDLDAGTLGKAGEIDGDRTQRQRMAQRDQLGRALG